MFRTKRHLFCLDFFLLCFSPVLLQVALLLSADVSSCDNLVPACASESGDRAAAILEASAKNVESLLFNNFIVSAFRHMFLVSAV